MKMNKENTDIMLVKDGLITAVGVLFGAKLMADLEKSIPMEKFDGYLDEPDAKAIARFESTTVGPLMHYPGKLAELDPSNQAAREMLAFFRLYRSEIKRGMKE